MNGAPPFTLTHRLATIGRAIETVLLTLVLGGMVTLAAAQIILRNVWGTGFSWADEALRLMVLWVTMLGAVAASREQRHVSIDALSRYLPKSLGRWSAVVVSLFAAVVSAVLAWQSFLFVIDSYSADDRVLAGVLPAWPVQAILPLGFTLISYRYAVACWQQGPRVRAGEGH